MVNRMYPSELQFNKAYKFDANAPVLDLHLSSINAFVSSKIMINAMTGFPTYLYISQLIRFARVSSQVTDFNAIIKFN